MKLHITKRYERFISGWSPDRSAITLAKPSFLINNYMILYYLLASFGLMCILKYGSILDKPRCWITTKSKFFQELFCCSLCLGFWTGIFIAFCIALLYGFETFLLFFPLASSGFCWVIDIIKEWFRKK